MMSSTAVPILFYNLFAKCAFSIDYVSNSMLFFCPRSARPKINDTYFLSRDGKSADTDYRLIAAKISVSLIME